MFDLLFTSAAQASLWAIMAIGVFLMYKILDIADLSVEGTFPLGAFIVAYFILNGTNPWLATFLAFIGGSIAGLVGGLIHTKLKIPSLITGILMMSGLYTINIKILNQSNVTLLGQTTLNTKVMSWLNSINPQLPTFFGSNVSIIIGIIFLSIVITLLYLFYKSELGIAFIATGDNEEMAQANSINIDRMKILGYMISNGLVALSGALIAQSNGYADINMGLGTIVIGLASLIIATVIFKKLTFGKRLFSIVLGAIIYRLILSIVLELNFDTDYFKLFSAILIVILLSSSNFKLKGFKFKGGQD
ncbi:MAG: ABC transporter permease [Bacilli bacterium]